MSKTLSKEELEDLGNGTLVATTSWGHGVRVVLRKVGYNEWELDKGATGVDAIRKVRRSSLMGLGVNTHWVAAGDPELYEGKVDLSCTDLMGLEGGSLVELDGKVYEKVDDRDPFSSWRAVATGGVVLHDSICPLTSGQRKPKLVSHAEGRDSVTIHVPYAVPYGFKAWAEVLENIDITGKAGQTVRAVAQAVVDAGLDVKPEPEVEAKLGGYVYEVPEDDFVALISREGKVYTPNPYNGPGTALESRTFYTQQDSVHLTEVQAELKRGMKPIYVK